MTSDTKNRFEKAALKLQQHGFRIFPLAEGTKDQPITKEPEEKASGKAWKVKFWWRDEMFGVQHDHNVGISMNSLHGGGYLIGLDVDNKKGRHGDDDLLRLELEGKVLPPTFEQRTPSGGRHLVFKCPVKVSNSHKTKVAEGIDVRGHGGYLVGAGSVVPAGEYTCNWAPIAQAPQWLIDECRALERESRLSDPQPGSKKAPIDEEYAGTRGRKLLLQKEGAPSGSRGTTAYKLAARLKDFGCSSSKAFDLLSEHWAPRCEPPMPDEDLQISVENAYRYGRDQEGSASAAHAFADVEVEEEPEPPKPATTETLLPIEELNKEYAFVLAGGGHHILREKPDKLEHINELSFHRLLASRTISIGNGKTEALTKIWMNSPKRRTYDGFTFCPGREPEAGYYNLWRGFKVKPSRKESKAAHESLETFKEHSLENICNSNEEHYKWLMGYFAHLVQRPWEKPLVSLVFRGRKGVGKNAVVDRIGHLLGCHYLSVARRRYLMGNFNSYLENCLVISLNEAFWSGDKEANGILKDLITESHHVIERKGQEPYRVENLTRVFILGNEDWVVPATEEERRFGVFDVGEKRMQDWAYFKKMKQGMMDGGHALLLQFLMDYDISEVNVDIAPITEGLLQQKLESLEPLQEWWYGCLIQEELEGTMEVGWPETLPKAALREAFSHYCRSRNIKGRIPDERVFGRFMSRWVPKLSTIKVKQDGHFINAYQIPSVSVCRQAFAEKIGHEMEWEK